MLPWYVAVLLSQVGAGVVVVFLVGISVGELSVLFDNIVFMYEIVLLLLLVLLMWEDDEDVVLNIVDEDVAEVVDMDVVNDVVVNIEEVGADVELLEYEVLLSSCVPLLSYLGSPLCIFA